MYKWIVEPLKKVNGIAFGANRDVARKLMNCDYTEFKKTKFSENTTDDFGVCHIFYDKNNKVEAFEIFPEVEIEISGADVFPAGLNNLKKIIPDLVYEDGGYESKKYSIGISMDGNSMESILVGCVNYYN